MGHKQKKHGGEAEWFSVERMGTESFESELEALLDDADDTAALRIFAHIAKTGTPDERENALLGILVMMERLKRHEEWEGALAAAQTILELEPKNQAAKDTIADVRNILATSLLEGEEEEERKRRHDFN